MSEVQCEKYNIWIRVFHWITAVIIIWASISGLYVSGLPVDDPVHHFVSWFNVSVTTLLIPLFVIRVIVRLFSKKPEYPKAVSSLNARLASYTQVAMYALTSIVLVSGILMMKKPISVFDVVYIDRFITGSGAAEMFFEVHEYSCRYLFLLVLIHVAAVLKHRIRGVDLTARMV